MVSLSSIRKRARAGTLEVEHVLREARTRNPDFANLLDRLTEELKWSWGEVFPDGTRTVPLARWAKVAAAYSRNGFEGLRPLAADPSMTEFVIALVEELRSSDAVDFLLAAYAKYFDNPEQNVELSFRLAGALNLLCSLKPAVAVSPAQSTVIQTFLFRFHACAQSEAQSATVLYALRGIGDAEAVDFVKSTPPLSWPYDDAASLVLRAIRKRLRSTSQFDDKAGT